MRVTFALITIEDARRSSRLVEKVSVKSATQINSLLQRFEGLRKSWAAWKMDDGRDYQELQRLEAETDRVMEHASLAVADVRIALGEGASVTMERLRIVKILRMAKKAIREGQKITHMEGFKRWKIPKQPRADLKPPRERRLAQNKKADVLAERRKRPLQCCMYVALAFSRLLQDKDLVAEYESEVVDETFDQALRVDDGKTYGWLQMDNHSLARLHPPTNRWPRSLVRYEHEEGYVPLRIRNPSRQGCPIITNQMHPQAASMVVHVNHNRENIPQNFSLSTTAREG